MEKKDESSDEGLNCEICLEEILIVSRLVSKELNGYCPHSFCVKCVNQVISSTDPLCPLCRKPVVGTEKDILANKLISLVKKLQEKEIQQKKEIQGLNIEVEILKQIVDNFHIWKEDFKRRENDAIRREEDAKRREEDAKRREEDAKRREDDSKRREDQLREILRSHHTTFHRIAVNEWSTKDRTEEFSTEGGARNFWNSIKWYNTCVWYMWTGRAWNLIQEYKPFHNDMLLGRLKSLCITDPSCRSQPFG